MDKNIHRMIDIFRENERDLICFFFVRAYVRRLLYERKISRYHEREALKKLNPLIPKNALLWIPNTHMRQKMM